MSMTINVPNAENTYTNVNAIGFLIGFPIEFSYLHTSYRMQSSRKKQNDINPNQNKAIHSTTEIHEQ